MRSARTFLGYLDRVWWGVSAAIWLCMPAVLAALLVPGVAEARSGGGTGHFGGGGSHSSGGGFHSSGSGLHSTGTGTGTGGSGGAIAVGLLVLIIGVAVVIAVVLGLLGTARYRKRRRERERQVELAAAEAADEDQAFAPERVRTAAETLFREIQAAWDKEDRERLAQLVGPDLLIEWRRRLDDFERKGWHNHVEVRGPVQVEYVGLVNRAADEEDRVCVRIDSSLLDVVIDKSGHHIQRTGSSSEISHVAEYWTLAKPGAAERPADAPEWILLSIEQDKEGAHQLEEAIVASPWSDTERLHEEAVTEQAASDKLPEGFTVADVAQVDFSGDARQAALDLALADGRFAPDVLEAEVRRTLSAWAEAVDGDDSDLRALAHPDVIDELLYPGDASHTNRLVIRGPHVRALQVTDLDPKAQPPTMTVEVEAHGRRYIENRDTATIVSGSQDRARTFTEHWTLALEGDDAHPWRIIRASEDGGARSNGRG